MTSPGLEPVLISYPVQGIPNTVGRESIGSLRYGTGLHTDQLLLTALFHFDTIIGLVAMIVQVKNPPSVFDYDKTVNGKGMVLESSDQR